MPKALTLLVLTCLTICGGAKAAQDQGQYERAISEHSTSPLFVLVTIKDEKAGTAYTGCVEAPFLIGAIFRELGGTFAPPEEAEGRRAQNALLQKAQETALRSHDHEFHFANPEALANVKLRYSDADLAEARNVVRSLGVRALTPRTPEYQSLGKMQWSDALACAITEQGALARRADITSQIFAEP